MDVGDVAEQAFIDDLLGHLIHLAVTTLETNLEDLLQVVLVEGSEGVDFFRTK